MAKTNTARANPKNVINMGKARGDAVATSFLKAVAEQGKTLARFLADIARMDGPARQAFRLALQSALDTQRDKIKVQKAAIDTAIQEGKPDETIKAMRDELYRMDKVFGSQKVRVSEARTFATAIDKMYPADAAELERTQDYHGAIANARLHLKKAGEASNRGRKATPADVKFVNAAKRFVDSGDLTLEGLKDAIKKVQVAMKGWEEPKANSGNKVDAPVDNPRKIGPTQRKERKAKAGDGFVPAKQPTHAAPPAAH